MDTQCEHDQLARQCLLCEQAAEKALRGEGGVMSEQTNIEDLLYEIEWLRADNTRLRELVVNVRNKEDIWCPPIPLPIAEAGGYTRKPVETMTYDEFVDWTIAYLLKKMMADQFRNGVVQVIYATHLWYTAQPPRAAKEGT